MMASSMEIQKELKDKLFDLLSIKKANPGVVVNELDGKIVKCMALMEQEDIAHVEKMISMLP